MSLGVGLLLQRECQEARDGSWGTGAPVWRLEGDAQGRMVYKRSDPTHLEWEGRGSVRLQYRAQLQDHNVLYSPLHRKPHSVTQSATWRPPGALPILSCTFTLHCQPVHDRECGIAGKAEHRRIRELMALKEAMPTAQSPPCPVSLHHESKPGVMGRSPD